jgi:hypothetical protein
MHADVEHIQSRREFFRRAGRTLVLGAMGMGGALLVRRKQTTLPGQTCINKSICCNCGRVDACGLPAALSAKGATPEAK